KTDMVSYEEMLKLKKVEEMVDKYYNSGKFNYIIKYFENKFHSPFEFYYKLGVFFENKGYFNNFKNPNCISSGLILYTSLNDFLKDI
ncbi:Radical SAM protein, partial [human gut metagenome]